MSKVAITDAEAGFVETWESVSQTTQYVIKLDFRGEPYHHMVPSEREFDITTEERLLTQKAVNRDGLDPFTNGCFRPVRVPEDITVDTNPNALSKADIERIFKASSRAWDEYLSVIDGAETLQRMVDLAQDSDDLSVKRLNQLQERLAEVRPKRRVESKSLDEYEKAGTGSGRRSTTSKSTRSASTV